MPQFVYRAINERGRSIRGTLAAANEVDLYQALQETGLELVDARQQGRRRSFLTFLARVTPRELIQLCLHMTELSRAGVPLLEGLNDIRDTTESPVLRDALSEVVRDVSEGATLSHAFAKHPKVFDHIFVSLIATGEQTGNLTESFKHLSHHLKWAASMRSKITKASRYPLFTLVVAMGVMFFLMVFVVPQVIELLKATGTELPMATVALIVFSDFMVDYWWAIIATMVGSWLLVKTLARLSDDFAFWLDGLYLRIPVLGPTMKKIALSRFAHFFAVTYQSGIEILRCLDSARNVLGHRTLAGIQRHLHELHLVALDLEVDVVQHPDPGVPDVDAAAQQQFHFAALALVHHFGTGQRCLAHLRDVVADHVAATGDHEPPDEEDGHHHRHPGTDTPGVGNPADERQHQQPREQPQRGHRETHRA